jgi:hypothetical protein
MNKLKAVAYYSGIPPNNSNPEKPQILDYFIQGVNASGDIGISHRGMDALDCDVALIQGFVHEHGKDAPHLRLRKAAIDLQKKNNRRSLIVDSSLFLYVNKENPYHYLRYSFDGVFPTSGFYFDTDVDSSRWNKISKQLNLIVKPWRTTGDHILICLQREGGWSMQGLGVQKWLDNTIIKIKEYSSKRKIIVRTHPGDKKINGILKINHKNVFLSTNKNLTDDLKNAWATVVYNSSPSVSSAIEGIPVFLTDPQPRNSQSFEVSNTDLSLIENPNMLERQLWLEKISMCHWNFEELKSGEAWKYIRKFV